MLAEARRFNVLQCGRRFGKTTLGVRLLLQRAAAGYPAAWFAPTHKLLFEPWDLCCTLLAGTLRKKNTHHHQLRLHNGGAIDFWSLDNPDSGRGRRYARIVVDEAGLVRGLRPAWERTIRPTLTDLRGDAWFLGTPRGHNDFHALYNLGVQKRPGWASWRFATALNPFIDPAELDEARAQLPPDAWGQEYLALPQERWGLPFTHDALRACITPMSDGPIAAVGVDLARVHDWSVFVALDAQGRVVQLERWQSDWRETRARLVRLIGASPALIDATGVGDPIVEDLARALPDVEGFRFTGQSRAQLLAGLFAAIQTQEIGIPEGWLLHEIESLEAREPTQPDTPPRYEAPTGLHDDGVMALALALRRLRTLAQTPTAPLGVGWY